MNISVKSKQETFWLEVQLLIKNNNNRNNKNHVKKQKQIKNILSGKCRVDELI